MTFGAHFGWNHGPNCAEAVNFADSDWIDDGMMYKSCKKTCDNRGGGKINIAPIVQKFKTPEVYKAWLNSKKIFKVY